MNAKSDASSADRAATALLRRVQRPWLCLLAALVLALSAYSVIHDDAHRAGIARLFNRSALPPTTFEWKPDGLYVVISGGRAWVLDPWEQTDPPARSEGDLWSRFSATGAIVWPLHYKSSAWTEGAYAPTRQFRRHALSFAAHLAEPEGSMARRAIFDDLRQQPGAGPATVLRELDEFEGVQSRPLWLGYLHNTLAAVAALVMILSFPSIPAAVGTAIRNSLARRRIAQGRCPRCGYPAAGLPGSVAHCPECGHTLARDP